MAESPAADADPSAKQTVPLPVEEDGKSAEAQSDDATNNLSKRAWRKEKRRMQWEERKADKKLKRQEQQRAKQASGKLPPPKELDMSDEAVLRRKERAIAKRETYLMAAEEGAKVVIDCGFEEQMTEKEKKSLSQQIMYVPDGEEGHCKESLVYIIGGIVDRNRLKGATYDKAVKQGIETAKLPLDVVVEMGATTRVLTVNHGMKLFEILVQFSEMKDWAQATLATLPSRKGVQSKQT
ncbi:hypothetical protein BBJ28_00006448 [Nothophytophthora sp. Chile5]|nr:hypothetical protein BBJ28_00006448 [Nothophytophthora sp. Chile5]